MPERVRRKRAVRRWWRRWSTPLDMIVWSLPLLAFWLLVAVLLFFLSLRLLRASGVQTADKETIALVGTLIAAIIGFAVQQWNALAQERKARNERRRRALREIEELRESLCSGEYARALSLYWAFQERQAWGAWQDLEVERALESIWLRMAPSPLRVWVELSEGRRQLDIRRMEREDIEALVWAWRLDQEGARQKLDGVVSGENLCRLAEVLGNEPAGMLLLRSPAVGMRLDALRRSKDLDPEQKKCLKRLRTLRRKSVRLPSPWHELDRPPDPIGVAGALKRLGLRHNPFGPEQAELDPWLKNYGVWPRSLEYVRGSHPALVFGIPGSGKTAAALLLMQRCLFPPGNPAEGAVFPVRLEPLIAAWPETRLEWLDVLGRAVAETLIQVGALDPYGLFDQKSAAASAIAYLWLQHLGPDDVLRAHLRRAGLDGRAALDRIAGEVRRLTRGLSPEAALDLVAYLDLLSKARPSGLCCTYVFVDWSASTGAKELAAAVPSLRLLLGMAMSLAARGVYLKMFLSASLRADLADAWFEEPISLTWQDDELRKMLQQRLEWAKPDSLLQICDREARRLDPDGRLVQAAKGSPRELVRLGNRMLAKARGERLTLEDLPQVR